MPLAPDFDLTAYLPYFYRNSLGLIGRLKLWISLAMAKGYERGSESTTLKHFKATVMAQQRLIDTEMEIQEGEKDFAELVKNSKAKEAILAGLLNMPAGDIEQ